MHNKSIAAIVVSSMFYASLAMSAPSTSDLITDVRVRTAYNALEYSLQKYQEETAVAAMYSTDQMNDMINKSTHLDVISRVDGCQFTPDIEDRARIVHIPAFEFAWADMLINGVCVKKDVKLGLDYLNRSAEHAYAPAYERLSNYYEKGFIVGQDIEKSEIYMKVSAQLGSVNGRLGWAEMLIRGLGTPKDYEMAYSWLYHTTVVDEYISLKKDYLQNQLKKLMPPNAIARAIAFSYPL